MGESRVNMTRQPYEKREERGTGCSSQEDKRLKVGMEGVVTKMLPLGIFRVEGGICQATDCTR